MADNNISSVPTPPPGFSPVNAAPTPPPGFTPLPGEKMPDLAAQGPATTMKDLAVGAGKEVLQTTSGIGSLIQKIPGIGPKIIPQSGLEREEQLATPTNPTQKVGGIAEQGLEFFAGEEGLKGLVSVAKVAKHAPEMMQMLEDYPTAAKIILGTLKSGAVGGAQGAVKGAATPGGAVKGAEEGATGGAIGGGLAEGASELLPKVAKMLGVGGQDFESAMNKAGRPSIADAKGGWKKSLATAKPILLDNIDPKDVKSIDDFVDAVKTTKDDLWKNKIQPQIDKPSNAMAPVTTTPIAAEIRAGITRSMKKHFPEDAAEMERMANNFVGNSTLKDLNEDLETFNAKLQSYYKMDPAARAAAGKTDGEIAGLERAADGMRELLYTELENRGEVIPRQLRTQYGALKDVERVFSKRIPVADRQGPLNLAQILSLAGGATETATALATGHPMAAVAGAVPIAATTIAKARSAPESLIRQGLKAGAREGTESTIGNVAKTATAAAGSQIVRDMNDATSWVRMALPNSNQQVEVHPEDAAEAEKRGLTPVK